MPMRRQIATAVPLLSPVIMMTRMPARRHSLMEAATSCLGGSSMPTQPTKVEPVMVNSDRSQLSPSTLLITNIWRTRAQMTEVQPRVSTDGRLRTMAFFLAMRRVPRARQVVMTAGRPSGMAATASATAILK
ncbi:hypothetical protein EYF80_012195 [Liparis tanakae]|uniref:Uncharacterized protein n=1 Tax=Liparis tanakae TaxID=230148 RepID=A0A4Z2IIP4_9TELE|nr:hypothetical protein EYF80_012195 [Liparis tanakae]